MKTSTRRLAASLAVATALAAARASAGEPPAPTALPARLDLETALRILRERGIDVLVAEAGIVGAEGDLRAAGAIQNPTASGSYGRSIPFGQCVSDAGGVEPCRPIPAPAIGIGLSDNNAISDTLNGKRGLRTDVARAALAAARLQRDDALRNLEASVKGAFVQLLTASKTLDFTVDVAKAQAHTAELSKARFDAGAISEADLTRIDVARLEADQAVDAARGQLRAARVELAFLLGVRGAVPEYEAEPGPFERSVAPAALAGATKDSLLTKALEARPDLLTARRQREGAESALALARRQRIPDVALSVNYAQEGTTNRAITPPTFTASLSLPLPLFYLQSGEIRRAEANLTTAELGVARTEATIVSDVESAWASYVAARALVVRMEGGLLDRAKLARDLVTIQYQKGAASLLDRLDAERTWIAVRIEYLQDLAGFWSAVFKLEQACGVALR